MLLVGFIIFAGMIMLLPSGALAGGSGSSPPQLEWSLNAELVVPDSQIAEQGTRAATAGNVDALVSKLKAKGVKTEKQVTGTSERGLTYGLKASGSGDVQGFRKFIHSTAKPEFNLLGE